MPSASVEESMAGLVMKRARRWLQRRWHSDSGRWECSAQKTSLAEVMALLKRTSGSIISVIVMSVSVRKKGGSWLDGFLVAISVYILLLEMSR